MLNPREHHAIVQLRHRGAIIEVSGGYAIKVSFEKCCDTVARDDLRHLEFLTQLEEIDLFGTPVDDDLLARLHAGTIREINLNCTAVTDRGISHICGSAALESLWLMNTAATDRCLEEVARCRQLTQLRVDGAAISWQGVVELCSTLPLERLWIDGRQASKDCLKTLAELPTLRELSLVGPEVTDETMVSLLHFQDLRSMALVHTNVTDAGVANLRTAGDLKAICLSHSDRLTDAAVDHLRGFSRVRHIWVVGTRITHSGKGQLKAWYPTATIGP